MKGDIRQLAFPGYELRDYIAEAIDFLRENEPKEGYFVAFSGGKDSIVTLELCRMAGVRHQAFYSCTRIDPPEVVRFIRQHYPDVGWLYPKISFWEGIRRNCPPVRMKRWCCDVLKERPADAHPLRHRVLGLRAEESVKRASRPRVELCPNHVRYKPIFRWPEWAVWEVIESMKIPYPALYDEGFPRIGCIVCPFTLGLSPGAIRQREMSLQRWPHTWKLLEKSVKEWWVRKRMVGNLCIDDHYKSPEEYWQAYLSGF